MTTPQSAPRQLVVRAPTRIDLGGGWTDVPPYSERDGGFVCNIAITRYATAHLKQHAGSSMPTPRGDALVAAAIRRSGVRDVTVSVENDFPLGAGLGGSSAASAAVLGALIAWRGDEWDRAGIAEAGRGIEVEELGIAGGRQDHYAATHGGALALTFNDRVSVRRIPLSSAVQRELSARAILIYTGQSRISGDTITAVLGAYEAGEARVVNALRRMRELAREMATALERSDLDAVGDLLHEHWVHQRLLHPSIPTAQIDEIVACAARAGSLGAKAMGASGGGCVLVMAAAENVERVRDAVRPLGELLAFGVDTDGLSIVAGTQ